THSSPALSLSLSRSPTPSLPVRCWEWKQRAARAPQDDRGLPGGVGGAVSGSAWATVLLQCVSVCVCVCVCVCLCAYSKSRISKGEGGMRETACVHVVSGSAKLILY